MCNFGVKRKKLPAPPALEAILNIHYTQRNYLVWIKLSTKEILKKIFELMTKLGLLEIYLKGQL